MPTLLLFFPNDATAPAAARRAVGPFTKSLSPRTSEELLVVVTELMANAVRHTSGDSRIKLEVDLEDDGARVEVTDSGEGFDPAAQPRSLLPERGGFGLVLVNRLARRWGVRQEAASTVVWSELSTR